MITTGIIRQINISTEPYQFNKYRVELNIFQTPGDQNKNHYTQDANCCIPGGIYQSYAVGDMVYVGFVDEDLSFPIILGRIYKGIDDNYRSAAQFNSLDVSNYVKLSTNTQIGNVTYRQLEHAVQETNSQESQLQQIRSAISSLGIINTYSTGNVPAELQKTLQSDIKNKKPIIVSDLKYEYLKKDQNEVFYKATDIIINGSSYTSEEKFIKISIDSSTELPTTIAEIQVD